MTDLRQQYYAEFAAAAEWWADTLWREYQDHDNGEFRGSAMLSLADTEKRGEGYDPAVIDAFEDVLPEYIAADAHEYGYDDLTRRAFTIGVDYHPDSTLAAAAEDAGIENVGMATFPSKTMMWIYDGWVSVSEGYHADRETIYGDEASYHLQFADVGETVERIVRKTIAAGDEWTGEFVPVRCALDTEDESRFSWLRSGADERDPDDPPITDTFRADLDRWADADAERTYCRGYEFTEYDGTWYLTGEFEHSVLRSLPKFRQVETVAIDTENTDNQLQS
jgi:hypothetical protein